MAPLAILLIIKKLFNRYSRPVLDYIVPLARFGVANRRHRCEYKADHQFDNGAHGFSLRKRPIVVSLIISSRYNDA